MPAASSRQRQGKKVEEGIFPDLLVEPIIATMSPLSPETTSDGRDRRRRRKNNRKEEDGEDDNITTVLPFDDGHAVGDNSRSRSSSRNNSSGKGRPKKGEEKKVVIQGPVSKFHKNREAIMTTTTANASSSSSHGILHNYHTTELQDDHPTSSSDTIRTHRTCGLCERLLPRSQFSMSAANAGIVHVALSPGSVTCRTCTMTVCAVQLKCLPTLNTMLDGYAQRGMAMLTTGVNGGYNNNMQQQQQLINGPSPPIAGLLQASNLSSSELTTTTGASALVISEREGNNYNITQHQMMADVNTVFEGNTVHRSSLDSSDRPSNVADCKYIDILLCMPSYLNLSAFGIFKTSSEISISVAAIEAVRLYGTLLGGGGDNSIGGRGFFVPHDCDGKPIKKKVNNKTTADDPRSVVCLVIGEGPIPRTAILASTHYGWTTVAIDPSLSSQWTGRQVDVPDFIGYAGALQNFMKIDRRKNGGDARFGYPRDNVPIRHLVIITIQPTDKCHPIRMTGTGHINEVRSLYDDAPTTVISLSPILGTVNPLAPPGAAERKKYLHEKNGLERDLRYAPNCFYVDNGIFSDCREIKVWNFHNIDDDDDDDFIDDDDDELDEDNNNDNYDYGDDTTDIDKRKEDQWGRLGGRRKGASTTEKHDTKASKNQGHIKGGKSKPTMKSFKRNDWLEKQVTNFMNESFAATNNSDSHTLDEMNTSQDDVSCDDTLSTKGSIFHRQLSRDIVDKPGGVMRNRLPEIGEIRTEQLSSSSSSTERQSQSHTNEKLADNIVLNNETVSLQQIAEEQSHDGQEILDDDNHSLVEYKCDKILESLDGNQSLVEYQCDDVPEKENKQQNAIMPHGWEAIFDKDSGEYYYTNWDTGLTTWDRPGEVTSNSDVPHERNTPDASLLVDNQKGFDDSTASTVHNSGHVDFADEDSVDSAIAALNRWNEPVGSVEDEEEVMGWSDDDEAEDAFDLNPKLIVRRQNNPWNKRDDDSVSTCEWK